MERATMKISGMTCGHCVGAVKTALDGVRVEDVRVGAATVAYDPTATSPARLAQAVEDAGYAAQVAGTAA